MTGIEKHSEYPSTCTRAASKWTKQAIVVFFLPSFLRKISDSLRRGIFFSSTQEASFFPLFLNLCSPFFWWISKFIQTKLQKCKLQNQMQQQLQTTQNERQTITLTTKIKLKEPKPRLLLLNTSKCWAAYLIYRSGLKFRFFQMSLSLIAPLFL